MKDGGITPVSRSSNLLEIIAAFSDIIFVKSIASVSTVFFVLEVALKDVSASAEMATSCIAVSLRFFIEENASVLL